MSRRGEKKTKRGRDTDNSEREYGGREKKGEKRKQEKTRREENRRGGMGARKGRIRK